MYILEPQLARQTMLAAFGQDRYKKFVAALNGRCQSKGRMFFWQDEMWEEVQKQLKVRISDFKVISELFRHCHVHGDDLEQELVRVVYGTRKLTGAYIEAMESIFPYANEVYFGPCWKEPPNHREVFFCNGCREGKKRWQELAAD